MHKIAIASSLAVLLLGCILGERPPASCSVSLLYPAARQGVAKLTATDTEVKEALSVINNILVTRGFSLDPTPPKEPNLVANYLKLGGTGPGPGRGPKVFLETDRLKVVVLGGGSMNAPLSAANRDLCAALRVELRKHFGSDRVTE